MSKSNWIFYKESIIINSETSQEEMPIRDWLKEFDIEPVCYTFDAKISMHVFGVQFHEWLEDACLLFMLKFGDRVVPDPFKTSPW